MKTLKQAVENGKLLGKLALYFGCWDQPGHYLHGVDGQTFWQDRHRPADLPWDEVSMDGVLLAKGNVPDIPDGRVFWTCGGDDAFWYAFYWWDRSVDKRGACNSGFYVRGFGYPEPRAAFDYACEQFPTIVRRQKFSLVLQENRR